MPIGTVIPLFIAVPLARGFDRNSSRTQRARWTSPPFRGVRRKQQRIRHLWRLHMESVLAAKTVRPVTSSTARAPTQYMLHLVALGVHWLSSARFHAAGLESISAARPMICASRALGETSLSPSRSNAIPDGVVRYCVTGNQPYSPDRSCRHTRSLRARNRCAKRHR